MVLYLKFNSDLMKKLFIILVLSLIPEIVSANVISLTTTISTEIMSKILTEVRVKILNSGDEAAYSVQASILLPDDFVVNPNTNYVGVLNPNEPKELKFNVSLKNHVYEGTYPLIVFVDYTDANGYPFSSVSPNYITYKTNTFSKLSGIFSELSLSGKESKKITLTLSNLDSIPHEVKIKLFIPRELKVLDDSRVLSVKSKEEKKLDFDVSSFSALAGSSYVVLASIEYDDNNLHYSSFAQTIVKIIEEKSSISLDLPSWSPIAIIVILIVNFIYFQFRKGKE
jgi:hypothetical protein